MSVVRRGDRFFQAGIILYDKKRVVKPKKPSKKKAVRRKSVGCIPSRSWMGVMLDTFFIFNLTFFVHIFKGNSNFKIGDPVENF